MGKRPLPLVSEFEKVEYVQAGKHDEKRCRVIRETGGASGHDSQQVQVVGSYRAPTDFLQQAFAAVHPVDAVTGTPEHVEANIEWIISSCPVEVCKLRLAAVRDIAKMVADNKEEERKLHSSWSVSRQRILLDKQMLTLGALAEQIGHPDKLLIKQACNGFQLVGTQDFSGYFEQQTVMACSSVEALLAAAGHNNSAAVRNTRESGDPQLDEEAWRLIEEEIEKGWISQPVYSLAEAQQLWPGLVVSRRFPIRQGEKVRLIDDFSESNVNLSYSHSERLAFHDVDIICACLNSIAVKSTANGKLTKDRNKEWLGRTLDLKAAYKQWAVADEQVRFNVICAWNPLTKRPALMMQYTLPFGALSAVVNFNRMSRLLWEILVRRLKLVALNFYDDYPMLEPKVSSALAKRAAETTLKLLGWSFADQGTKCAPFSEQFVALGVVFDVSRLDEGQAVVFNKQARVEAIQADLTAIANKQRMTKAEKESIRGRLQFLERHVFGRVGKFVINALCGAEGEIHCHSPGELVERCHEVCNWLSRLSPREIRPSNSTAPVLLFTDGAEGDVPGCLAACGAAIFDPVTGTREHFGTGIPDDLVLEWKRFGAKKIIAQAELLPILLAKIRWKQILEKRRVLIFVDNESAKSACINMYSMNMASLDILRLIAEWEIEFQTWSWYSRVASYSNVADAASRLQHEEMRERFGTKRVQCYVPNSLKTAKLKGGEFVAV